MKKYLISIITLLNSVVAFGATFYVVPGGAGIQYGTSWASAYADVQTAIDAAANAGGGEVWIKAGTYKHGSPMIMKNNVAIYGGFAGTETSKDQRVAGLKTYLDGNNKYRVFSNIYNSSNPLTNSAKLDNVVIQNGKASSDGGGGMYNYYASPTITNCTFSGNSASSGGGMYNYNSSPALTNCTFSGNTATRGGGMYNYSSSTTLTNCTFSGNTATRGGGMYNSSSSPRITNCTFSGNSADYGGGMYNDNASPTMTNCIFWGDTATERDNEIYNYSSSCQPKIDTCIIQGGKTGIYNSYGTYTNIITANPKLAPLGNYGGNVQTMPVQSGSSAIGAGKVVSGVSTDARGIARSKTSPTIGAFEFANKLVVSTITTTEGYVKYSSDYEFTLNANVPDVATPLTYQWYKDGVAISGATASSYKTNQAAGGAAYTVKVSDGQITITSAPLTITTVNTPRFYVSTTGSSSNDGLTWATAKSDVQEAIDLAAEYYGGEVWIAAGTYKHGAAMTMKNNVAIYGGFAENETNKDQRIAGQNITYLDGENSYRVFNNYYTKGNPLTSSAKLDNVVIQNGKASSDGGGGMYNYYASPTITNCTFSGNQSSSAGGGMYNYYASPTITNCTFSGNWSSSAGGGMGNFSSSPTITNCTFSGNTTPSPGGGGMGNSSSSPTITNCTFSGNKAYSYGAGMYNYSSSPTITNCIFWSDIAQKYGNEIYNTSDSTSAFDTCIIQGGTEGIHGNEYGTYTNIITADPKLAPLGNYGGDVQTISLLEGSSAIGAGKVVEGVETDARGYARSATAPTIGAYEFDIVIATQPTSITVHANSDATLMVVAFGENLTYQWYKDGTAITDATSATLTLEGVQTSDAGTYYCVISNFAGGIQTDTVSIIVKSPPIITEQPTDITAYKNSNVSLSVIAVGESITYQWYKDGTSITDATSATLTLEGVQTSDAGTYYCVISNFEGNVQTNTVRVVVDQIPPIYYVIPNGAGSKNGSSWANAYADVQEAIDAAAIAATDSVTSEVWIKSGTYKHGSAMTMKNNVAIYGGFSGTETHKSQRIRGGNTTCLDGENKYKVFSNVYDEDNPLTNSAKLDNVIIQNGYAQDQYGGGGIYNYHASPILTHCSFYENCAYHSAGGGICNDTHSNPTLENCLFDTNTADNGGGGMYNRISSIPRLTNCIFINNTALRGYRTGSIVLSTTFNSTGGAIYAYYCSPIITNCTFINNSALGEGGAIYTHGGNITNCTFMGNSADYGGAIGSTGNNDLIITNCTFNENSASRGGGMYNISSSNAQITNCIFWNDSATEDGNELYNLNGSNYKFDTCIIQGGREAIYGSEYGTYENIITTDPKLGALGDYGGGIQTIPVNAGSSAIGRGKIISTVEIDARGVARSKTLPTIGAYESEIPVTAPVITAHPSDFSVYANANCNINIKASGEGLSYQWYKDGTAIDGEISDTLNFKNIQVSSKGSYYCIVSNPLGVVQSHVANIFVYPAPIILTQPAGFSAYLNDSIALRISAYGEGLTYQWYKDGVPIENATEPVLNFSNIQTSNAGTYYCIVSNPAGMIQSHNVNIVVKQTKRRMVYYVTCYGSGNKDGSSWANAFSNVQTAINAAAAVATDELPAEVWIAVGTYEVGSSMVMKNNVEIYGGFDGSETSKEDRHGVDYTRLDGNNSCYIFYNNYSSNKPLTSSAKIDNVVIQHGTCGMRNVYANPTLTNCIFIENNNTYGAGMSNSNSNPILTNCIFSENKATYLNPNIEGSPSFYPSGGGMYNSNSNPILKNCTFTKNEAFSQRGTAYGGGMYNCDSSAPMLIDCTFNENKTRSVEDMSFGGGIYNAKDSNLVATNCIFDGNEAQTLSRNNGGGAIVNKGTLTLTNCIFRFNSAHRRPGASLESSHGGAINTTGISTIKNCTFIKNQTSGYDYAMGGAIYFNSGSSSLTVTNSVFIGNSANATGNSEYSYGGAIFCAGSNDGGSDVKITNCIFAENASFNGGAIAFRTSYWNAMVTNCTFTQNSAIFGGIFINRSNPIFTNCILWDNQSEYDKNDGDTISEYKPKFDTCIIKGGTNKIFGCTYENIIDEDPKLGELGSYGGIIQTIPVGDESSAIGAGKIVADIDTDARGVIRSKTSPTIGAFEYKNITRPQILIQPTSLQINVYGNGSLSVVASGECLTYQWYKDGIAIEGETSSILNFQDVKKANEGFYKCVITNPAGNVQTDLASILVIYSKPKITMQPTSVSGYANNSATLTVVASGADLTYQWYKDGTRISGATSASLTITNEQASNFGSYYCIVSNSAGSVQTDTVSVSLKQQHFVYYVTPNGAGNKDGSSWDNAFSNIQDAINEAATASVAFSKPIEVWVAAGTYYVDRIGMKNNVEIYGGFAGTETSKTERASGNYSILQGTSEYNIINNSYTSDNTLNSSAKLDSFILNGGYNGVYNRYATPTIINCTILGSSHYGVSNAAEGSPIIANCTIANHELDGIYNQYGTSNPTINNCTIVFNKQYGIRNAANASSPRVVNTILYGNKTAQVQNNSSATTFENCIIQGGTEAIYNSQNGIYTNIITANPKLGELGDNGGSVQTIPVLAGSSAIGTGKVVEGLETDARGYARSATAPTIGAYEYLYGNPQYEKWFLENNVPQAQSAFTATPRNDGITNLEKFAFGLDGTKPASYADSPHFMQYVEGGNMALCYPISVDAEGTVSVKALMSTDLINWTETSATQTGTSSDGKYKLYKATAEIPEGGKVFLKLKVEN